MYSAFLIKENNQKLLLNLEQQKEGGEISADTYTSLKHTYQQKVMSSVSDISHIKHDLGVKLQTAMHKLNSAQIELDEIRASYSAGKIPVRKAHSSERKLLKIMEASIL